MKRKIISVICILSTLSTVAYAAPIDSLKEDTVTGNIMLSGDFSAQCNYSVLLLKPNVDASSLSDVTDADIMEKTAYMLNTSTSDGKYDIKIPMSDDNPSGVYTVSVRSTIDSKPTRQTITWYNPTEITAVFDLLKNSTSADDILAIINSEENCNKVGISHDLLKNLSLTDKTSVAQGLYNKKADIINIETLQKIFNELAVPKALPASKTSEEAKNIILNYAENLGISDTELFEKFSKKDAEYQKTAASKVIGKSINDTSKFADLFKDVLFLTDIKYAPSATDVNKILNENKSSLSSKVDKYFSKSNTSSYDKLIAGKSYDSVDDLEDDIVKLLNSSGGSGGSGSGGGGGISVGTPTPPKDNNSAVISAPVTTLPQDNFFDDLETAEWAKNAIESLAQAGVISGKGNKKFCPQDYVIREEFIKMLVCAFNITAEGSVPFNDVSSNAWYYDYVVSAYNSGMVKGISSDRFGTGTNITRQDMTVLVYRYLSEDTKLPNSGTVEFTDKVEISEYAREAVAALREAGIVSGMTDGTFKPKDNCTRAQVAYIIYKALKYAGKM